MKCLYVFVSFLFPIVHPGSRLPLGRRRLRRLQRCGVGGDRLLLLLLLRLRLRLACHADQTDEEKEGVDDSSSDSSSDMVAANKSPGSPSSPSLLLTFFLALCLLAEASSVAPAAVEAAAEADFLPPPPPGGGGRGGGGGVPGFGVVGFPPGLGGGAAGRGSGGVGGAPVAGLVPGADVAVDPEFEHHVKQLRTTMFYVCQGSCLCGTVNNRGKVIYCYGDLVPRHGELFEGNDDTGGSSSTRDLIAIQLGVWVIGLFLL